MRPLLRCVLLWLLALALPVQGIAAVSMQHCSGTHRPAQPMAAAHAGAHGHAGAPAHVHDAQAPAPADETAVANDAASDGSAVSDAARGVGSSQCSACAACCVAVGLPPALVELAAAPVDSALHARPATVLSSTVPDRLERPPRAVLA